MKNKKISKFMFSLCSVAGLGLLSSSFVSVANLNKTEHIIKSKNESLPLTSNSSNFINNLNKSSNFVGRASDFILNVKDTDDATISYYVYGNNLIITGAANITVENPEFVSDVTIYSDGTSVTYKVTGIACDFKNCDLDGILNIPSSITFITPNAFDQCDGIYQVNLNWEDPNDSNLMVSDFLGSLNNPNTLLTVPKSIIDSYKDQDVQKNLGINRCNIQNQEVMSICSWIQGENVRGSCELGTDGDVYNIKGFTAINPFIDSAIETLSLLQSSSTPVINQPTISITKLSDYLFQNCSGLQGSVSIDSDITSIGSYVFDNCTNVSEIRLYYEDLSGITISPYWLGNLANKHITISVPADAYKSYVDNKKTLGIENCEIQPYGWASAKTCIEELSSTHKLSDKDKGIMFQLDESKKLAYVMVTKNLMAEDPMIKSNFTFNGKDYKVVLRSFCFSDYAVEDSNNNSSIRDAQDMLSHTITVTNNTANNDSNNKMHSTNLIGVNVIGGIKNDRVLFKGKLTIQSGITTIGENAFAGLNGIKQINLNWTKAQSNKLDIDSNWLGDLNNEKMTINVPSDQLLWYLDNKEKLGIDKCVINGVGYINASQWIKNAKGGLQCELNKDDSTIHINGIKDLTANNPIITSRMLIGDKLCLIDGIKDELFKNDVGLTGNLIIDSSITSIGKNAFDGCIGIKEIHLNWTEDQLKEIFSSASNSASVDKEWLGNLSNRNVKIVVPKDEEEIYKQYATDLGVKVDEIVPFTPINNLPLILGLSLGIGIPALIGIVTWAGVGIYRHNKHNKK